MGWPNTMTTFKTTNHFWHIWRCVDSVFSTDGDQDPIQALQFQMDGGISSGVSNERECERDISCSDCQIDLCQEYSRQVSIVLTFF